MKKMEYDEIRIFIDNIENHTDEEILESVDYIVSYFEQVRAYDFNNKFKILAVKSVKDLDKKVELIKKYFYKTYDVATFINWQVIVSILENLSSEERISVFKKLFSNSSFKEIRDALNIPCSLKFGIELEYDNLPFDIINSLFANKMISDIMKSLEIPDSIINSIINNSDFEKENEYNKWIFSKEGEDAPEASTPIMLNNIDNLNQISAIICFFKAMSAKVSEGTGLHINVGTDYFEGRIDAIKYLFIIWSECEELFYKIANAQNEEIRKPVRFVASPIKENIEKNTNILVNIEQDFYRFIYDLQARDRLDYLLGFLHGDLEIELMDAKTEEDRYSVFKKYMTKKSDNDNKLKYTSVNFKNLNWNNPDTGRIEFRLFNSTLSIQVVLENILLIGRLCEICLNLAKDSNYKRVEFNNLLNHDVSEEVKLDNLLELLFESKNEKQIFKSRWQSIKDERVYDKLNKGNSTYIRKK